MQNFYMRLIRIFGMLILLFLTVIIEAQENPEKTPLPSPFAVKMEEAKQGNYLPRYLEFMRLEKEYRASKQWYRAYMQSRAYTGTFLGDIREADRLFDESREIKKGTAKPLEKSPLEDYKAVDAVSYLLKADDENRVLMLNDGHHQPQTRVLTTQLLRGLYDKGFRYLAMETLSVSAGSEIVKRIYPVVADGYYTNESVFGDMLRQALEIGYTLIPYEWKSESREGETGIQRANRREIEQARNLKERVFDKDPKAKLLVFAGISHISEKPQDIDEDVPWTFMATRFKEMTGIDPFTVDETTMTSRSQPDAEEVIYSDAVRKNLVKDRAVIFADESGKSWTKEDEGMNVDAQVFLPPVKFADGRPDWLKRDLNRVSYKIPKKLLRGNGLKLVQAFFEGEPDNAVPVDQVLIRSDQPVPALMLPKRNKGEFRLRVLDETGKPMNSVKIKL